MCNREVDEAMHPVYQIVADEIMKLFIKRGTNAQLFIVGISGPPGVGKSTASSAIQKLLPRSVVVPMDGYHFTKAQLREFPDPVEAFARRGAEWTFDGEAFVRDMKTLKDSGRFAFPSFDHGVGDPIKDAILVDRLNCDIVIVEGNYLLLPELPWSSLKDDGILDFSIFIRGELDIVNERVYRRHISVGRTEEEAKIRVDTNDSINAVKILSSANRADLIIDSQ